jgi:hypothetical protein
MGGLWMAVLVSIAGALSAASGASGEIGSACSAAAAPSSFDYLVLASMADSQRPIAMASYRPASVSRSEVAVQLEQD